MYREISDVLRVSRRRAIKLGASLFAFVPAAAYLAQGSNAFAYTPCSSVICNIVDTVCANYDCQVTNHYYDIYYCLDAQTGAFCYSYYVNTGYEC